MPHAIQTNAAVDSSEPSQAVSGFDFNAPAELFPCRIRRGRAQTRYKRFDTAAEAVRFVIEDVAPLALLGAYLEVDETRFGMAEVQELYRSAAFPLERLATSKDS